MVRTLAHEVSEGLNRENAAHVGRLAGELEQLPTRYPTCDAFLRPYLTSADGLQVIEALSGIKRGARIVDIGAGQGQIAIHLARQGHRVAAVEPSLLLCQYIERAAKLYRVPLEVYQTTGESLHRLPLKSVDACIFNSSLHHCDDPLAALVSCHRLLRPGGQLFLLNEPRLPLYRSKAWFQRQLETDPEGMGHYGGNEHIYYLHEYVRLLRQAGFDGITTCPSLRYQNPDRYLSWLKSRGMSAARLLRVRLLFTTVRGLQKSGVLGWPLLAMLRRLSMLEVYFVARRGRAAA
jgi:2-polyprenyl-3-methyl-5-hydroxy-6-metoxy-1,4-benzoquinol methylase